MLLLDSGPSSLSAAHKMFVSFLLLAKGFTWRLWQDVTSENAGIRDAQSVIFILLPGRLASKTHAVIKVACRMQETRKDTSPRSSVGFSRFPVCRLSVRKSSFPRMNRITNDVCPSKTEAFVVGDRRDDDARQLYYEAMTDPLPIL